MISWVREYLHHYNVGKELLIRKKHYRRNNKLKYIEIREKLITVYKLSAIKRVRSEHITCNMVTVVGYAIWYT